jgi:hypothetical protein
VLLVEGREPGDPGKDRIGRHIIAKAQNESVTRGNSPKQIHEKRLELFVGVGVGEEYCRDSPPHGDLSAPETPRLPYVDGGHGCRRERLDHVDVARAKFRQ